MQRLEEAVGSPETGFADGCEPTCACWKSNPGLLEEKPVLLTSDLSLQGKKKFSLFNLLVTTSREGSLMLVHMEARVGCLLLLVSTLFS